MKSACSEIKRLVLRGQGGARGQGCVGDNTTQLHSGSDVNTRLDISIELSTSEADFYIEIDLCVIVL